LIFSYLIFGMPLDYLRQHNSFKKELIMNTIHSLRPFEEGLTKAFFGKSFDFDDRVSWKPLVNVEESDDSYRVELELPGLSKEDVHVRYEDELLIVEGERKNSESTSDVKIWRNERPKGKFSRSFRLMKDIDSDSIQAQMNQGVLTLTLFKSEKAKARLINISGE